MNKIECKICTIYTIISNICVPILFFFVIIKKKHFYFEETDLFAQQKIYPYLYSMELPILCLQSPIRLGL